MKRPRRGKLDRKQKRLRGLTARGLSSSDGKAVDPQGGMFNAGIIRGFAVVTRGEALGHGYWLDADFVKQTTQALAALQSSNGRGAKARFTHPSMSADGLGRGLGRARDGQQDGDMLRADLHLSQASHQTPEGDLGGYVLQLAEEDPESFGASIVYEPDWGEELRFESLHQDEKGYFRSPDPDNTENLPHARLHRLLACDIVGDPAANPAGMFSADPLFTDVEALARYACGMTDDAPELQQLDHDPQRVRVFISRFLDTHNLQLTEKDMPVTKPGQQPDDDNRQQNAGETPPEATSDESQADDAATATGDDEAESGDAETGDESSSESDDDASSDGDNTSEYEGSEGDDRQQGRSDAVGQLRKFTTAFGAERGVTWFEKGFSFEQATNMHEELQRHEAASDHDASSGEEGLSTGGADGGKKPGKFDNALGEKLGGYAASLKLSK